MGDTTVTTQTNPPRENPWMNFGFNLILPILLLTKAKKYLPDVSPTIILILALACPIGYFIYDYRKRNTKNIVSILGMTSVLLTGGIGLLRLSPFVFAIKEALFPAIIGLVVIGTLKSKTPLLKTFLYNPSIMDTEKVERRLDTEEKKTAFEKLMLKCTWILASSFFLSAILNFIITRIVVKTDPKIDLQQFNDEVGKQTGITWVVLTVMTMPLMVAALWQLFAGIKKLTGLGMEDVMIDTKAEKEAAK